MWPNAKLDLQQEYTVTHQGNLKTRHQKSFKRIKHGAANKPPLTLQFADWFLLTDTLSTHPLTCTLFSHRHTLHSQADSPHLHSQDTPLTGRLSTPSLTEHSTHRQTLHTFTHRNTPLIGKLSTSLIGTLTTHPLTNSDTLSLYSQIQTPNTSTLSYILAILLLMEILSMSPPLATFPPSLTHNLE